MERITIIGHLGQDAAIKSSNGNEFITFTVAVSQKYKNGDGVDVESTQWYNCIYQPKTFAVAQYLKKGTKVFVEGRPKVGMYTNKEGKAAIDFGVQVRGIELLSSKPSEEGKTNEDENINYHSPEPAKPSAVPAVSRPTRRPAQVAAESMATVESDDLPF